MPQPAGRPVASWAGSSNEHLFLLSIEVQALAVVLSSTPHSQSQQTTSWLAPPWRNPRIFTGLHARMGQRGVSPRLDEAACAYRNEVLSSSSPPGWTAKGQAPHHHDGKSIWCATPSRRLFDAVRHTITTALRHSAPPSRWKITSSGGGRSRKAGPSTPSRARPRLAVGGDM